MGTYYHNRSKCIGACIPGWAEEDGLAALTTPTMQEAAELALFAPAGEHAFQTVTADAEAAGTSRFV